MSGVRGDARKRQQGEHLTHWDAGVRAVIAREVAKERERLLSAFDALAKTWDDFDHDAAVCRKFVCPDCTMVNAVYDLRGVIAREAGQS